MSRNARVLVSRLSAVGDCILTIPLASAVKQLMHDVEICWITQPATATLLQQHASVDHVIVVAKGWLKSPSLVCSIRRQLRRLGIDLCFDPQSLTKSAAAGFLSGARRRVGFLAPQGRELAPWLNNILVERTAPHVVDAYFELLKPFDGDRLPRRFDIPSNPLAEQRIADWLDHLGNGSFAAINPGAGWHSKRWPPSRYAELACLLGRTLGIPSVVVWAGLQERQWAEQIAGQSGGHAVVAPPTDLLELAALLRRAALFVGSDTGPMHLAAAVGTRCIAMFGPTLPEDCGPYGAAGHIALQRRYQAGTSRQRRRGTNDAMCAITVNDAWGACRRLLADDSTAAA